MTEVAKRNGKTAVAALMMAVGMLCLGYAAVPLYRIFCQVTGFAGTTQVSNEAKAAEVAVTDVPMSIRFDANVDRNMGWEFRPEKHTQDVKIGQRVMAFYVAKNLTDKPITGVASYNVEPEQVGYYFNKVQCFCFNEQTLQPGEEIRMPVIYYVDPEILKDKNADGVQQITLSYTFHRKK